MATNARKRINITLPEQTLELIDQFGSEGRSEFTKEAVQSYAQRLGKAELKRKLKLAYIERADEDRAMAQDWEPLEREAVKSRSICKPRLL